MATESKASGIEKVEVLDGYRLERILSEDARNKSACLLGYFSNKTEQTKEQAIIILEKTHFSPEFYSNLSGESYSNKDIQTQSSISHFASLGSNDVYYWLLGWMAIPAQSDVEKGSDRQIDAHVKLTIIRPATEAHILKYTEQSKFMISETSKIYENFVEPWIKSQEKERIQWVYNILEKKKESETILYEKEGNKQGFIILPDLKWDQKTLSSLYLVAIVQDRSLQSLRDLKSEHVPLLRSIMQEGQRVAHQKFGLGNDESSSSIESKLRCFIHYQPTYYHLHVHLLSSDYTSHPGALVGQAHLLEDVIDLLEMGVDFKKRTLTYSLGSRSPLLKFLKDKKAI